LDIRLLGPLEVLADDGVPLSVTAPLPRATLAALALRAGRPVAADLLAGQLWGADRPADARAALRGHVARLRRVLPGGAIHTVPGGYRLALAPGRTDVGRFEEALCRARERAAAAPAEAVATLDASATRTTRLRMRLPPQGSAQAVRFNRGSGHRVSCDE
jgi:DNA-binding SARP family transcriptional activator